jgi:hypothetical protein
VAVGAGVELEPPPVLESPVEESPLEPRPMRMIPSTRL